ncbi:unnamed protein product [Meganyctiphanes norvegica]|uniref:ISXO2-like transposase domain-containing protein n=1 Tax=Meganyctiphanes norvegica TaxID=48144 RepID=A0AAV2RMB1_MEGNR
MKTEPVKMSCEEFNPHYEGVLIISLIGKSKEENIICDPDLMFTLIADSEFVNEISSSPIYNKTKNEVVLNIKDSNRIPYLIGIKEIKNNHLGNWPIECHSPICSCCHVSEYRAVGMCYHNNEESLKVFRHHGVLPMFLICPECNRECLLYEDKQCWRWMCHGTEKITQSKKQRQCGFSVSDYNGTFLERSNLEPWQILLFINIWVRKHFCYSSVLENLEISMKSNVAWRSFCSEVTQFWFNNQKPIGGDNIVIEIDEMLFVEKMDGSNCRTKVSFFSGIERESKKCFVIPLVEETDFNVESIRNDYSTFIPLIKKYIAQKSILYSDKWKDISFNVDGYIHKTVNQSNNFVDPKNPEVHTQCIKRLWRDIKEWMPRPGMKTKYLKEFISRYLFLRQCKKGEELHNFLIETAKLYKPQNEENAAPISLYDDSDKDLDSEEDVDSDQETHSEGNSLEDI